MASILNLSQKRHFPWVDFGGLFDLDIWYPKEHVSSGMAWITIFYWLDYIARFLPPPEYGKGVRIWQSPWGLPYSDPYIAIYWPLVKCNWPNAKDRLHVNWSNTDNLNGRLNCTFTSPKNQRIKTWQGVRIWRYTGKHMHATHVHMHATHIHVSITHT